MFIFQNRRKCKSCRATKGESGWEIIAISTIFFYLNYNQIFGFKSYAIP